MSDVNSNIYLKRYFSGENLDSVSVYFKNFLVEKLIYKDKKIKFYIFYDRQLNCQYVRRYFNDELVYKLGFPNVWGFINNDIRPLELSESDTVKIFLFAPTIHDCKSNIYLLENSSDSIKINSSVQIPGLFFYERVGLAKGARKDSFSFTFLDNNQDTIQQIYNMKYYIN